MIYLFNQTEELIDVIDKASLAEFTHTIELNQFDRSSFEIPVDYKPDIIKEAQFFGFQSRDRAFCLFRISEKSYDIGLTVQGIDRAESDLHSFIIEDKRPGGTASDVLREILKGTGYQLGNVDGLTRTGRLSFYYISVRQALVKIIESYACEFKIRYTFVENKIIGRYIDLNQRFGRVTGHQFEYGSNILNVTYEESSDDVVTALIGRGKGEESTNESGETTGGYGRRIQFKDVSWSVSKGDPVDKPAGQNYVSNETARNIYGLHQNGVIKHRFGVYTNEDIEDPVELLKATYKELQRLSIPIVTFKANLLDLANAIEQDVWIGDSVGIVRDQIGIAFEARIHKLIIDKLDDNRSAAELGDYQTLQAKDRTTRQQAIIDAVSGFSESLIEEAIANEVQRRDKEFDEKMRINKLEFDNALESAKAKAEEVKRELSDTIDQRFSSFDNGPLQDAKRRAEEALRNAGASSLLAQEAKQIGLDSVAKLDEFKRQATSAQSALSWNLDTLKRTVISEINQASEHRRTTTEALSRMTGQMNGFATKSEVKQDIDGLTQTFAKMKVGGVNLLRNTASLLIGDRSKGYWMSSSGGNGRAVSVEVLDPPQNMIKNMIRIIENTNGGNKDLTQFVRLLVGEKYTISCYARVASDSSHANVNLLFRSWANDTDLNRKFQKSISHTNWQKYSFTFTADAIENSIQFGQSGAGIIEICAPKIESGTLATDWSPALEDTEGIITEAKATFEQTAQGLRTDLSAIQGYVNKDSQRKEELQRYTREESARQANAVRELVTRDYVGKATYQEDVRGLERRFSVISTQMNNDIATKIAQYKQTVDGQFLSITSQIAGKANQTDFQRVQETSQLYERILGNTDNGIADNVARMAVTNQLFQIEVGKYGGGGPNLVKNSDFKNGTNEWSSTQNLGRLVKHGFYHNSQKDLMRLSNSTQSENFLYSPRFELERNTDYVLNFRGFNNSALVSYDVFILGRKKGETNGFTIIKQVVSSKKLSTARCEDVSITFNSGEMDNAFIRFDNNGSQSGTADLYITEVDLYKGYKPRPWQPHPEDIVTDANAKLEAIRTQMTLLQGSWAVQNLTSAGSIVSQINATNNQILIEAEKIRLKGKTLLDELTAIQGYFKRLFVGEGTFATLNADVIRTNSITADKLVINEALANRLVSNEIITSKLVASRAFVNALKAVTIDASQIVTGTLKGDRIYGGVIRGAEINGTRITGDSRITIGDNGFLRPTQYGGLQINVPETYNANKGVGIQIFGRKLGVVPKGMFIYNSPSWVGGEEVGESVADTLLTVKGLTSLCNLFNGKPMSGLPINSNFSFGFPVPELFRVSFIAWDARIGQLMVNDGTNTQGTWWFKPDLSTSDKRLKTNIQDTDFEATDFVKKLEFKQFDWKPDKFGYKKPYTNVGLIAQDVEKLDSSLVYPQGENLALDDFRLGNIALKAIQELSQRIETLERKLA